MPHFSQRIATGRWAFNPLRIEPEFIKFWRPRPVFAVPLWGDPEDWVNGENVNTNTGSFVGCPHGLSWQKAAPSTDFLVYGRPNVSDWAIPFTNRWALFVAVHIIGGNGFTQRCIMSLTSSNNPFTAANGLWSFQQKLFTTDMALQWKDQNGVLQVLIWPGALPVLAGYHTFLLTKGMAPGGNLQDFQLFVDGVDQGIQSNLWGFANTAHHNLNVGAYGPTSPSAVKGRFITAMMWNGVRNFHPGNFGQAFNESDARLLHNDPMGLWRGPQRLRVPTQVITVGADPSEVCALAPGATGELLLDPCDWYNAQGAQDWAAGSAAQDWATARGAQDWAAAEDDQDWANRPGSRDWFNPKDCD